ncbi:MAG: pyridoxal-phosphate dependent enzyme [Pseudomonadota bacterium]
MTHTMPTLHPSILNLEGQLNQAVLASVSDPLLERFDIALRLKRDDLLHPIISGNKWRKLKYLLDHALNLGCRRVVSMGGPYSNHLHALAFAGRELGIETVGLIRGEPPERPGPTLRDLDAWGMPLHFVPRADYRELRRYKAWNSAPATIYGGYWVPEGGANPLAMQGVAEIVREIDDIPYDAIAVACGTGTTLAGVAAALPQGKKVLGFSALKNAGFLDGEVTALLTGAERTRNWEIFLDYHFGGFAKVHPELLAFMARFEVAAGIPLDPVYTGKMLFGLYDMISHGYFKPGTRIVAIHTGGLQGRRGLLPCRLNYPREAADRSKYLPD